VKLATLLIILCLTALNGNSQDYWNPVNSGTQKKLLSVSFGSNNVGYISGEDSLLLKTINGGISWNPVAQTGMDFSLASKDIVNINFVDANTGYAIVSNFANPLYLGALYKTIDGGQTWTIQVPGNIAAYRSFFFDGSNGFLIGSAFFAGQVVTKLSAGSWGNYNSFSYSPDSFLYAVDFLDTVTGIVGGAGGYVYRTLNGGASWDTVKTVIDSTINAIIFLDDSTILAATDNSGCAMIISFDTGRTWQLDMNSATFAYPLMKSVVRSKKDLYLAAGHSTNTPQIGVIYRASNGSVLISSFSQALNEIAMRDDSIAFAVGDSGLIVSNYKFLLGIEGIATEMPINIYPNPSYGVFTIEAKEAVTIAVFDITGRMIVNRIIPALSQRLDLSQYAKGVYEIRVTNGLSTTVRKILLQ
jgi:photosystem II stability/assembly factor-like uncharacterized protein